MAASSLQDSCYAWVVCVATFLVLVIQCGIVYSMGIFYIMFQQGLDAEDGALSLVTSLNYGFMYLICPFVGILTEMCGERPLAITGAFLGTIGLACSSFTSKPYHLYITYGLIAGIGGGMVYNPCISILEKYFRKYLRIATGLAVCGSGVGAFIFPPIIEALEDKYGWRGALLLIAGIYAHIIIFSCLYQPVKLTQECTYKTAVDSEMISNCTNTYDHSHNSVMVKKKQDDVGVKLMKFEESITQNHTAPQNNLSNVPEAIRSGHSFKMKDSKLLDLKSKNVLMQFLSLFKSVPYTCLCLYSMFTMFPIALVYTHLGSFILTLGFTKSDVVTLYIVIGITTTITRVLYGTLGEFARTSPPMIVTVTTISNGILTILLPFAFTNNMALVYVYGVLFSIMVAPYDSFCLVITVDSVQKSRVATGFGVMCFFCVPGCALGAPLAAWLYDYTNLYASSFYLAGGLFILAALMMVPALCQTYRKGLVN